VSESDHVRVHVDCKYERIRLFVFSRLCAHLAEPRPASHWPGSGKDWRAGGPLWEDRPAESPDHRSPNTRETRETVIIQVKEKLMQPIYTTVQKFGVT